MRGAAARPWSWRRRSLRARLTLAATVVVAGLLAAAGAALVWRVHTALLAGVDSAALRAALSVASAADGTDTPRLPAVVADGVAQVVDPAGHVVAASDNVSGQGRLFFVRAPASGTRLVTVRVRALHGARYRLAVTSTAQEPVYLVYIAMPLNDVAQTTTELTAALAIGGPALLAALAAATWLLAGRALYPVEVLRRQAAAITVTDLHRRVDVPLAGDEVARLASTLNNLLARLEASTEQQRRFIADAAHELRSPIASVRLQTETMAASTGHRDPQMTSLSVDVRRLSGLVEDLLALARLDAREQPAHQQVDLDDVVLAEVRSARVRARVPVDISEVGAARVLGEAGALARVVRNLLDNAVRHAEHRVGVALGVRDGAVVLTVADDGPGIPAADRERIFERFTRLDDARDRDAGGSGLGLAIARETVVALGGTVRVQDAGPGARVVVTLPVAH